MMRLTFILILSLGLFLSVSSSPRDALYQVTSAHPHDLSLIAPFIETTYQNGRLHVVRLKTNAPVEVFEHLRPLTGRERSYLPLSGQVLGEKGFDLASERAGKKVKDLIPGIIGNADSERIKKDVEFFASLESRYVGTEGNALALDYSSRRLVELGYVVSRVCYTDDACNLVAEKNGSSLAREVMLVVAHIDSVGEEFAGADDNASGVSVVLEMARLLKDTSLRRTVRFLITNGEELGLLGSSYYVKTLQAQNELNRLKFVINMDMVAYNSNGIVELETNPEFDPLAKWYALLVGRYTSLKPKITLGAWGSDHVPFLKKGIPSLLTIENWDTKTPCYHQACDRPETLNYLYATEIGKLNAAAILSRDQL